MPPRTRTSPAHIQVGLPGVGDRLSDALRGAYGRDRELPADMLELLSELDRQTKPRGSG